MATRESGQTAEAALRAPEQGSAPIVTVRGARATLGSRPVLRGIDLAVHNGEVVALLGANGSGKSTAVRSVIGQVPLTDGEITLFSTPLRRFRDWARVGYVPQRTTAASGVPATVREVVASGRLSRTRFGLPGRADRAAVERAIDLVGLTDRAKDSVDALSGGQHQRVLIARALAAGPELLIMDEPMAGVDLASQDILAATLREQVAAGTTVLLVLHELGPLEPLIDRAVVLRDGCVVHDGPPPRAAGRDSSPSSSSGGGPVPGDDPDPLAHPDPGCHPHAAGEPLRTGLLT
ncbi:metal ABC transporter ATP-binding protein [Streptomyces sp. NPDC056652]|uniref:metal ABC transporter ATP-binding protein n=1 Tax=Streptomyces sp. NPDC056652 TaxID=3345893 RepID=UPI0036998A43